MKKFSDFNITVEQACFVGDKIKMSRILNRKIIVHAYKIGPSKHYKGDCIDMQVEVDGTKYVCFSGSQKLKEQILQVPESGFPFEATIVVENEAHLFV